MVRGYPKGMDEEHVLGRGHQDAERLFPRFTSASAASAGEVTVNGKVLKLWTFQQLEALNTRVLKDRALAIRAAVGEADCPQIPSGHASEIIRWIMNMQAKLTESDLKPSRHGHLGSAPVHFLQEQSGSHPAPSREDKAAPFGPRQTGARAAHDNYYDLKLQRGEFEEAPVLGIQSMRRGGEGRRHLDPGSSMLHAGVSTASPEGIQSLRDRGEGRRHLHCEDHLWPEPTGPPAGSEVLQGMRSPRTMYGHVGDTNMSALGTADPPSEQALGITRRRHFQAQDHMAGAGAINTVNGASKPHYEGTPSGTGGRRKLDGFKGGSQNHADAHGGYVQTWKKEPSRLHGTSMLC